MKTPILRFPTFVEKGGTWQPFKVEDLGKFLRGQTYSRNDVTGVCTDVLIIRSSNLQDAWYVDVSIDPQYVDIEVSDDQQLKKNDVVICTANGSTKLVGKASIYDGEYKGRISWGAFCAVFRPSNELSKYFFSTNEYKKLINIHKQGGNGALANLNIQSISKEEIYFPVLEEEQQKIAAFFTALDEKIKIQKDVIEILILQREQFLRDFFSRKIGFCEKFGLKSTDWVSVQLKDICEIKTGPFGSLLHAEDYVQKGIPIVTTEHFKKGSLPLVGDGIPQVSLSDSERLSSYKLETGDIVFSRVGSVDINALVEECHSGWLFSGRVLRVRCNESVDARFLHYALSTNVVKKDIIARAVGLTMASINTSILEETKVEIPVSQKEQEFIGEFMNFLDKRITIKEQQLNELVRLKRAFMQQMFV